MFPLYSIFPSWSFFIIGPPAPLHAEVTREKSRVGRSIMQIFMRLEYERVTRTVACDVDPRETLYSLKCKIQDKGNGIRPAIQRITYRGKQICDSHDATLASIGIQQHDTIHIHLRWCGILVVWGDYGSAIIPLHVFQLSSCKAELSAASKIPEAHLLLTLMDGTHVPFTYSSKVDLRKVVKDGPLKLLDARDEEVEVEVVSVRTREQRDAAGRKRAIDLDDDAVTTPPQRVRAADDDADLTTRVAKAHSLMQPKVDSAYRALLQPHFSAYAADEIDAAELDRRKQRAHEEAASQHQPALSLNRAHSTYESASRAAAAAYEAYEAAAAAAAAAKLSLESELRAIEGP